VRLPRRDIGDEKGATLVIVALSLVLIFTLVALAVDVGFSLVRHRGLVNAADAAALAAAESLATNDTTDISCDFGTTIAEHQACSLAKANDADAQPDGANWFVLEPGIPGIVCTNCGRVTVKLQAPQQQFFAPIFGGSSSEIVHTEATAIYGPAISSLVPPIMVEPRLGWDPDHLVTCDFTTLVVGEKCNFWFDQLDRQLFVGTSQPRSVERACERELQLERGSEQSQWLHHERQVRWTEPESFGALPAPADVCLRDVRSQDQ